MTGVFAQLSYGEVRVETGKVPDPAIVQAADSIKSAIADRVPNSAIIDLRISVGITALKEALDAPNWQPTLAVFVSSSEFEQVLRGRKRPDQLSAIFNNPDPLDQLSLAEALLGRARLGVFDTPIAHSLIAKTSNRPIITLTERAGRDIDSMFAEANGIDVLLVFPDSTTLNRANISHVVRTLYQRRAVLIGYSNTLTKVGSLASVYVTPEALTSQIINTVMIYADKRELPVPSFVSNISISLNEQLARSLNISLPSEARVLTTVHAKRLVRPQ